MRLKTLGLLALSTAVATACNDKGVAYGDANSVIVAAAPDLWAEVEQDFYDAIERTVRTTREEKTFTVTYQQPLTERWGNLRRFRQMVLVGTAEDPWVAEALAEASEPINEPGMHQVYDVWSLGQNVTVLLLPPGGGAEDVRGHLPALQQLLDEQYRQHVHHRMFLTGADTALADTLMATARFSLILPEVYRWERQDSVFIFRNDNPDPSELIRQVAVTWRSPIPPDMQPEGLLDWRAALVAEHYTHPQDVDLTDVAARPFKYRGLDAYEIRAIWVNPPELNWPAAGPFILRAVVCPQQDRMYLIDSWLYAPDKEKYEYMLQLETILDSFRCGAA